MDDLGIKDEMVNKLVKFIAGPEFQSGFEKFFLDHATAFTDDEEQKLEYTEIYQKFQEMFDKQMEKFMGENNLSEKEFALRCRKAMDEDARASQYLDIIIASMDYSHFVQLMKLMRNRAKSEGAEAKNSKRKASSKDEEDYEEQYKEESKDMESADAKGGDDDDENSSKK